MRKIRTRKKVKYLIFFLFSLNIYSILIDRKIKVFFFNAKRSFFRFLVSRCIPFAKAFITKYDHSEFFVISYLFGYIYFYSYN